jgi:hypothetical protein
LVPLTQRTYSGLDFVAQFNRQPKAADHEVSRARPLGCQDILVGFIAIDLEFHFSFPWGEFSTTKNSVASVAG